MCIVSISSVAKVAAADELSEASRQPIWMSHAAKTRYQLQWEAKLTRILCIYELIHFHEELGKQFWLPGFKNLFT